MAMSRSADCDIDNKHKEAQSTNQCFRVYGLDADMLVRHLGNPQSQVGPPEFYLKSDQGIVNKRHFSIPTKWISKGYGNQCH